MEKEFKEYLKMYDYGYLIEILHRNIYEYALMDGYDESDKIYNEILDFLHNKLKENENEK